MKTYFRIVIVAVAAVLIASCNFLDVAPAQRATLKDAMKNKASTESWLYGCYEFVQDYPTFNFEKYEGSTDEFVTPRLWSEQDNKSVAYCTLNASNIPDNYWRILYGEVGNVNLFLRELKDQNPAFLTEQDKAYYIAQTDFLKAYYYSRILNYFGPCPIVDEYASVSTTKDQFPGRYHYDYVVDYIVDKLDAAFPNLYAEYNLDDTYGLGNKTACAALKSRVLLYAASPLWNGSAPWPSWENTAFETPGYGKALFSREFSIEKWRRAKDAAVEALRVAKANGRQLFDLETAMSLAEDHKVPWRTEDGGNLIPGVDTSTPEGELFAKKVLQMRYLAASDETIGNKEYIFSCMQTAVNVRAGKPRNIILGNNSSTDWRGGWAGLSPTLNMVEMFYTKNGKLPAKDPDFTAHDQWLNSAGIPDRPEIINLNVEREPRFYAWITFDGADIGPLINDGKPLRVNLRNGTPGQGQSGYDPNTARDNNQTGYLTDKWFAPRTRFTKSSQPWDGAGYSFPIPLIRMAELYLNLAECCAEIYMHTGDAAELQMALDNVNMIRERAGVPALTSADLTDDMTIRDWVRAERTIELFMEGHRYYDLRRWAVCNKYLAAGVRTGLDAFVSKRVNPTIEQFNQRVPVDGDYRWLDRMYLLPINSNELYMNPQMVQAPGY